MTKRSTKEECEKWISEFTNSRYEILFWPKSGKENCKILDKKRNFEFECRWRYFVDRLKLNNNTIFFPSKEEMFEIYKQQQEKNNDPTKKQQAIQKAKKTNLILNLQDPLRQNNIREKIIQTNIKKYGVKHPKQNKEIALKGVEKISGAQHGIKIKEGIQKIYGVENVSSLPEILQKRRTTKIKNGYINLIDGKMLSEIALEKDVAYTTLQSLFLKTKNEEIIKLYQKEKTNIEIIIENFLKQSGIKYVTGKQLPDSEYKPDFLIEDKKLIIECDGLYWHSEIINKDVQYHKHKKNKYKELGYDSLFFREDEILNKVEIVKSIINNKLNQNNNKIFARKCTIVEPSKEEEKSFFEKNHLMGHLHGKCYALKYNTEIVAAIIVRHKYNKKTDERWHDVARICSKIDHSVVGGVSKLIKHAIKDLKINKLTTYIDLRYGDGEYYSNLGFQKANSTSYPSFKWTNFKTTIYRQSKGFEGNNGYKKGFVKIWDCGQTRWDWVNLNKND